MSTNYNTGSGTLNGNIITPVKNNDTRPYMCKNYAQKVISNLNTLRKNSKFCDIELISGDTVVKVDKIK